MFYFTFRLHCPSCGRESTTCVHSVGPLDTAGSIDVRCWYDNQPFRVSARAFRQEEECQCPAQELDVLVVPHCGDCGDSLRALLFLLGYRVRVVKEAQAAFECAAAARPRVALLDLGRDGLDAYELAGWLRAGLGESVRLVAMLGSGEDYDGARAAAAGFDHLLRKPVGPEGLLAALGNVKPPVP